MSHISKIELVIHSLEDLKEACRQLGFEFMKNQNTYKWYGRWVGDTPLPEGINIEDIGTGFIKLKSATGNIETYAYSHYKYVGNNENADWFEVFYKCRFKNGKGSIKLSIRSAEGISEITGINIYLDEL